MKKPNLPPYGKRKHKPSRAWQRRRLQVKRHRPAWYYRRYRKLCAVCQRFHGRVNQHVHRNEIIEGVALVVSQYGTVLRKLAGE